MFCKMQVSAPSPLRVRRAPFHYPQKKSGALPSPFEAKPESNLGRNIIAVKFWHTKVSQCRDCSNIELPREFVTKFCGVCQVTLRLVWTQNEFSCCTAHRGLDAMKTVGNYVCVNPFKCRYVRICFLSSVTASCRLLPSITKRATSCRGNINFTPIVPQKNDILQHDTKL